MAFLRTLEQAGSDGAPRPNGTASPWRIFYIFYASEVHFGPPTESVPYSLSPRRPFPGRRPPGAKNNDFHDLFITLA